MGRAGGDLSNLSNGAMRMGWTFVARQPLSPLTSCFAINYTPSCSLALATGSFIVPLGERGCAVGTHIRCDGAKDLGDLYRIGDDGLNTAHRTRQIN